MPQRPLLVLTFFLSFASGLAQKNDVDYYEDIQPIILTKCTSCHRPNTAAPFSLLTYEDVKKRGDFIAQVTASRYMPPWKADLAFQSYKNERTLSEQEIALIRTWVENGMTKGKKKKNSKPAEALVASTERPDLSLTLPAPYKIQTNSEDDYRFFNLPTNLPEDKFITKIEFVPGNARLVHHSRLMTDT